MGDNTYWIAAGAIVLWVLYQRGSLDGLLGRPGPEKAAPPPPGEQVVRLVHQVQQNGPADPAADTTQKLNLSIPMEVAITPKPPRES